MKKLINLAICVVMLSVSVSNVNAADCTWSTDIKKVNEGYLYTNDCHARVGVVVKDLDDREKEVVALRKTIELKDLVITKADERVILWRNESYEQFERLQKQSELSNRNQTLYFILGIVVTGAAVWGAGQLR